MNPSKDLPPPQDRYTVRRALLSVFDKTGLVAFARKLAALNVELLSTGGTAQVLREANIPVTDVSSVTDYPEMMDGRVKTLHPLIHGGLLARRTDAEDLASLSSQGGRPIDLVVVNLYPFEATIRRQGVTESEAVENIDIGGPAMLRAAAKNFHFVGTVTSPGDYDHVADELEANDCSLSMQTRKRLATKAFRLTAAYDAAVLGYFSGLVQDFEVPDRLSINAPSAQKLRYGENPHQAAGLYGDPSEFFEQLHGKELSFNNILDLSAAFFLIDEFRDAPPTAAILKHTNPCGVGTADTLSAAYEKAFATDRQSPFGGIVCVNRPLDLSTAEAIDKIFTEIIIAPDFEDGVLDLLAKKKNRRLIRALASASSDISSNVRSVLGGFLVQEQDPPLPDLQTFKSGVRVVTDRPPTEAEWIDLVFAWRIVKHVKSNAIVYARGGATVGIGAGQMSRIDSSELAVAKAGKSGLSLQGSVIASDAFFPFADGLVEAARAGATAAIEPGGSVRDEEVIAAANEHDVAMVFTGRRHFRH